MPRQRWSQFPDCDGTSKIARSPVQKWVRRGVLPVAHPAKGALFFFPGLQMNKHWLSGSLPSAVRRKKKKKKRQAGEQKSNSRRLWRGPSSNPLVTGSLWPGRRAIRPSVRQFATQVVSAPTVPICRDERPLRPLLFSHLTLTLNVVGALEACQTFPRSGGHTKQVLCPRLAGTVMTLHARSRGVAREQRDTASPRCATQ